MPKCNARGIALNRSPREGQHNTAEAMLPFLGEEAQWEREPYGVPPKLDNTATPILHHRMGTANQVRLRSALQNQ